jgi:hypothetical protein
MTGCSCTGDAKKQHSCSSAIVNIENHYAYHKVHVCRHQCGSSWCVCNIVANSGEGKYSEVGCQQLLHWTNMLRDKEECAVEAGSVQSSLPATVNTEKSTRI